MTGIEKILCNFSAFHFIKAGSNSSSMCTYMCKVFVQKFEFPWVNAFDLFTSSHDFFIGIIGKSQVFWLACTLEKHDFSSVKQPLDICLLLLSSSSSSSPVFNQLSSKLSPSCLGVLGRKNLIFTLWNGKPRDTNDMSLQSKNGLLHKVNANDWRIWILWEIIINQ